MRTSLPTLLVLVALLVLPAPAQESGPDARRGLTAEDVMNLASVLDVVPAPDGRSAVYVVIEPAGPDAPTSGSKLRVMYLPAGEDATARRLIASEGNVSQLAWSADGSRLYFLDRRDGDAHREVWALPMDGPGDATRVTKTKGGVSAFAVSPDDRSVAFTALDPEPEARAAAQKKGYRPEVVDENDRPISLWIHDVEKNAARRATEGVSVHDMVWSPDGAKLALQISPRNTVDDSYMARRIHVYHPGGDRLVALDHVDGKLGGMAWSPDGERIAFVGAADRNDPHAGMLWVVDESAAARLVTPGLEAAVESVVWAPRANPMITLAIGVETGVVELSIEDGKVLGAMMEGGLVVEKIAVPARAEVDPTKGYYAVASTASHPSELYRIEAGGEARRLTDSNPWLDGIALGRQEVRRVTARDGLVVEGLLIHPPGVDEGTRTPLVVCVHGGPEAHFSNGWITRYSEPGQVLAARGYRVWYPNYRSSTGYGVAFVKHDHGDLMGGEFDDHVDAIRAFAEAGLVDPARVGIIGGSYGGYTAAWAATKGTEHFAAAVSFVPFVDIRTKWLTSDIPNEFFLVHYEEKWPHEQVDYLAERSPLTHAALCDTPLLLVGGDADPRVHPSQPFMLYRAVKFATDTPVRYVRYAGEGHGNRLAVNRYDLCLRALRWFDHYLAEGDRRDAPLPPADLDYGAWKR